MKKDLTELIIIIDKSGSMNGLESDVIGGYNSLIEEQKKEGETKVTTLFFDSNVKWIYENKDINEIVPLEEKQYRPSGCTALLDAIGNAIVFVKERRAKLKAEDIPEHTIFSIMTDGYENASREYTYKKIKEMIEFQKKCGWNFLFQAANIDVEYEADRLGIDMDDAVMFEASSGGVKRMMKCCSASISRARKTKK